MEKLKMETKDLIQENIEKLAEIFPGVITEARDEKGNLIKAVNFEMLKQELSDRVVEGDRERYQLTWPGKKEAILLANLPTNKTLRPIKEESVEWESTGNLYIEGDNLEALKILQESYLNKVKCIYIDPPYNTGKDFIYKDNFKQSKEEYLADSGQVDENGNRLFQNTESNGRFHSDWLSMMYPRLKLARNLLREDGVFLISIDDHEVHNLRKVCDELFGVENFIATFVWRGGKRNAAKYISVSHEYILFYVKSLSTISKKNISWKVKKRGLEDIYKKHNELVEKYGSDFVKISNELKKWYNLLPESHPAKDHKHYCWVDERGVYFASDISRGGGGGPKFQVINPLTGNPTKIPSRGWSYSNKEDLERDIKNNLIHFTEDDGVPCKKRYLKDNETQLLETVFYKDRRSASSLSKN